MSPGPSLTRSMSVAETSRHVALRDGDWTRATLYTGLSFVLGLTAVFIGIGASSVLLRVRG